MPMPDGVHLGDMREDARAGHRHGKPKVERVMDTTSPEAGAGL